MTVNDADTNIKPIPLCNNVNTCLSHLTSGNVGM